MELSKTFVGSFFCAKRLVQEHLYEAKLLILGEGGVGKTTLAKSLISSSYALQDEKTTEGVDVTKWSFPIDARNSFRVNIWDFGGQEIYHTTHQFFLTKRSLYILVVDTRKDDTDFYYWLNMVELFSENSPLLIVQNEKQDRHRDLNERQLSKQFENLKEVLAVNLATNRGLDKLKTSIEYHLKNLPHIGTPLPKSWIRVRQRLENDERNYIALEEYLVICKENGFGEAKDSLQLSQYLNDIGVCLHFQDDPLLVKTIILKPKWSTDAVYKVLDNQTVINNQGRFTRFDLDTIWDSPEYETMHDELLQLMMKFKLCYEIPTQKGTYIAPQLLTEIRPEYQWNEKENLLLRYQYDFMPKGILLQFIVVMSAFIWKQNIWKSGVLLEKDKTRAEVIEFYGKREIHVRIVGAHKEELITLVLHALDKIHATYKRLKVDKLIPCNCAECKRKQEPYFYRVEILQKFMEDGGNAIQCQQSYRLVQVRSLLDNLLQYENFENVTSTPVYESKLLIVGEPGAGKTSLMKKLIDSHYALSSSEDSTIGINIEHWIFPSLPNPAASFQVNIWDFGGQEIQYMLHHFFMTSQALYILVADDREQRTQFDYWFRIINLLGGDSPVLVVLNEKNSKSISNFDHEGYRSSYSKMQIEKREVDLGKNDGRLIELSSKIKEMLSKLNPEGKRISNDWIKIRQILEEEKSKNNYITIDTYFQICEQNNLSNEDEKLALSKYLHDLGYILHFQKESDLHSMIILNPSWAVDGTYAVLSNQELADLGGRFSAEQIFNILDSKGYSYIDRNILLNLMKKDIFEICYSLPYADGFIAPQLLPKIKPHYIWNNNNNLRFQFQYPFMPKGILSRLIVRLSGYILPDENNKDLVWAQGVLLKKGEAVAEVIETTSSAGVQVIAIRVCSTDPRSKGTPDKNTLLTIIREELLLVHKRSFGDIRFNQMIPCNCAACLETGDPAMFSSEELDRFIELGKYIQCRSSGDSVNPKGLIDDIIGFDKYLEEQSLRGKPVTINVQGDYIEGEKSMTKISQTIKDSTIHGSAVAAESIKDSFNIIDKAHIKDDLKEYLKQLAQAVDTMNKELPPEKSKKVEKYYNELVKQATDEKPDPEWYNVSITGLIKAAENLDKLGEPVINLSRKVLSLLTGGIVE